MQVRLDLVNRNAVARGELLTKSEIARRGGVDRSIFYGNARLQARFDQALAEVDAARRRTADRDAQVTAATLRADSQRTGVQPPPGGQVAALETRLSELLGQPVLADLPDTTRAAITRDHAHLQRLDDLESEILQVREELRRREEDLDGFAEPTGS